ncbi:hypothetical protein [Nocardioides ferulae]|uniref:hypothetical protein n=1 Tax=Nocardioides ferulae TaxID=2340821 RepID=UPI000EB57DA8|nr:hypothetical protein [Nocardioides ferulae]
MLGPIATVTCHDADRPDLAGRLRSAAADRGLTGWVTEAAGSDGTVAVLEIAVGDLGLGPVDGGEGWTTLSRHLGSVLDEVAPAIALGAFTPVLDLDEPDGLIDGRRWCSGRVDLARLDADQTARFDALADRRLVEVRDGAARWATPPGVPLGADLLDVAPLELAAATYRAWTGETADPAPPPDDVDDANTPVLWCWTDGDAAQLAAAVAAALPDHGVDDEQEYGPLSPVVVTPPVNVVDQSDLLAALRTAVAAGAPAWAGLLPRGGVLPPGVAPELPESGVVDHLWLSRDWAGDLLPTVADALAGAPTDEVAGGVLFVTGPDPREPGAAELVWPPMVRYERLVAAATLLGQRLRADTERHGSG